MTVQRDRLGTLEAVVLLEQFLNLANPIRNPGLEQVINFSGRLHVPYRQVLIEGWPVFVVDFVNVLLGEKEFRVVKILQIRVEDLFRHAIIELLPAVMRLFEESRNRDGDLSRVS